MSKIFDNQSLQCPTCGADLSAPSDTDRAWLDNLTSLCPNQHGVEWWPLTCEVLRHPVVFCRHSAVALLGGHILAFEIQLRPGEVYKLNLMDYGLGEDAAILFKNYTGQGKNGVWPLEVHGNEPISTRHAKLIYLYGRPFNEADLAISMNDRAWSKVNVYLVYVPQQPGRHTSMTLARACEEFLDKDYPEMLIPASVAVEDEVKRLAAECLAREGLPNTQGRNRELLLDSLLPLYCKANSRPWLPPIIREKIRRLWGLRDSIAHLGRLDTPLAEHDAAELLAAAILMTRFVQVFRATM